MSYKKKSILKKFYNRRRTFDGVFFLSILLFVAGVALNLDFLKTAGFLGMLIKAVDR